MLICKLRDCGVVLGVNGHCSIQSPLLYRSDKAGRDISSQILAIGLGVALHQNIFLDTGDDGREYLELPIVCGVDCKTLKLCLVRNAPANHSGPSVLVVSFDKVADDISIGIALAKNIGDMGTITRSLPTIPCLHTHGKLLHKQAAIDCAQLNQGFLHIRLQLLQGPTDILMPRLLVIKVERDLAYDCTQLHFKTPTV